jgi:hypothetical protein
MTKRKISLREQWDSMCPCGYDSERLSKSATA